MQSSPAKSQHTLLQMRHTRELKQGAKKEKKKEENSSSPYFPPSPTLEEQGVSSQQCAYRQFPRRLFEASWAVLLYLRIGPSCRELIKSSVSHSASLLTSSLANQSHTLCGSTAFTTCFTLTSISYTLITDSKWRMRYYQTLQLLQVTVFKRASFLKRSLCINLN